MKRLGLTLMSAALLALPLQESTAAERFITVQSTTSTQNSGLFESILPQFTTQSGIEVRVVAVGTGQAIRTLPTATATCCSCTPNRPRRSS